MGLGYTEVWPVTPYPRLKVGWTVVKQLSYFWSLWCFLWVYLLVYLLIIRVITSEFTRHLCALSGIEQHQSVIYYPSSNGRAEAAVKAVVMALRNFLSQRPGKWVQSLPLAVWGLNDLPGLIAPYSPLRIVFGRDPVGFGDLPPFVPGDGAEDAIQFFQREAAERKAGCNSLTAIHDRLTKD